MDLFEQASRKKLRFQTDKGALTTEQLWDLPLVGHRSDQMNLDNLAQVASRSLKAAAEESFVVRTTNPARTEASLQLEVLKHIIEVRLAEAEEKKGATSRAARRQQLLEILSTKDQEALMQKSRADLEAELRSLS